MLKKCRPINTEKSVLESFWFVVHPFPCLLAVCKTCELWFHRKWVNINIRISMYDALGTSNVYRYYCHFLAPIILNKLASAKHKSNVSMTLAFHSDSIWPPLHLQLLTELSNSNLTKGRWRWMSLSSTSREECRFGTSCLISSRINIGTQESRERKTTSTWHGRTVIATHMEV